MAQSNGPGPRAAGGLPPQHPAGANGQQDVPVDPRYGVQAGHPGQSVEAWQVQGQQPQNPNAPYGGQDPQTLPPGYSYPQSAQPGGVPVQGGQPDPRYNQAMPAGAVAPGQSPYAPQFTPYEAPAVDPYQQPQQPQQTEVPVTGAPYNPQAYPDPQQGYPTGPGVGTPPQTMDNPAFPQHAPEPYQGQVDPVTGGGPASYPADSFGAVNAPQPVQAAALDPHGFDAGGFAGAQPGVGQPVTGQPDYLAQPDYAAPAAPPLGPEPVTGFGAPEHSPTEFAGDPTGVQPGLSYGEDASGQPTGAPGAQALDQEPGYENEEYGDQYDEPSAGGISRTLLIVGVLVGAIVVGGGLAYGWKMLSGSGSDKVASTPVVAGGQTPHKTRPADPGGQQFDHTGRKIMGRLGEARSAGTDSNGTRKVPTVNVTRDGRISAIAPAGEATVSVPGLTVVDAFGAGRLPGPTAGRPATGKPIVVAPPATKTKTKVQPRVQIRNGPNKPVVISKKATPTLNPAARAKPVASAPVKKKAAAPKKTARAPAAAGAPATSSGANGYVAVLASVPVSSSSRMNALGRYADLRQKYSAILANKTPDVREANLGAKGKYHRLLVGPPGSRSQASALCSKLKTAGYSGCWVTSF